MSFFDSLEMLPEDPILSLPLQFKADSNPRKVNLGIGVYQDSEGKPYVFESVREAETRILKCTLNKDYPPIPGNPEYIQEALKLVFGEQSAALSEGRIFGAQSLGGTGGARVVGECLFGPSNKIVALSDPCWPNHRLIFEHIGFKCEDYPYYDTCRHCLRFADMCATLEKLPAKTVVLLQASCHNPTGLDLTPAQWEELSQLIKKRHLIPFFDLAYQGLGKGLEADAQSVRLFADQGHEMAVTISFSKNFGLYGERAGALAIVTENPEIAKRVASHVKQGVRSNYSMPPLHPGRIVANILLSPELKLAWKRELEALRSRISEMREAFAFGLYAQALPKDYSHLTQLQGMFSLSGFTPDQVKRLRTERGIHLTNFGRINIAGLNQHNLQYVIDSFSAVIRS